MNENFSLERMERASKAMVAVSKDIIEFNKVWDEMTEPEKWATGGMVYHISSIWGSFTTIGNLAVPPLGSTLTNVLNNFVFHPEMFPKPNEKKNETKIKD